MHEVTHEVTYLNALVAARHAVAFPSMHALLLRNGPRSTGTEHNCVTNFPL